jgi:general secretion pathway protein J
MKDNSTVEGFTLVEILIAVFILTIVLSTIYAAYTGTLKIIKISEQDSDIYAMGRSAMQRMTRDLGSVSTYNGRFEFISKRYALADREFAGLSFKSTEHVEFSDKVIPTGIATINYLPEEDSQNKGYLLMRYDTLFSKSDAQDPPQEGFILCDRLHSLTYRFYDATGNEYDAWDSTSDSQVQKDKAPSIISIHLTIANTVDQDHPYRFMTKVSLPMQVRQ